MFNTKTDQVIADILKDTNAKSWLERTFKCVDRFWQSLPSVLFWGFTLTAIWVFGFEVAVMTIIFNLMFVGLPAVMLVRWMMKRKEAGKEY